MSAFSRNLKQTVFSMAYPWPKKIKLEEKWRDEFFFVKYGENCFCLLCETGQAHTSGRSSNLKRHFETQHAEFHALSLFNRKAIATALEAKFFSLNPQIAISMGHDEKKFNILKSSYLIAHKIVKQSRAFTEGEFVKDYMIDVVNLLCPNELDTFQELSLSRTTITRRICDIAEYVTVKSKANFEEFEYFSLALDESTDVRDKAQLLIFVRGITKDFHIIEELAELRTIKGTVKGKDIYREVTSCMESCGLRYENLINITTDGAPAMVGNRIGFRALFEKDFLQKCSKRRILFLHCIIHQEVLSKNVVKLNGVTSIVTEVINFIRGSKLRHRQFVELVELAHDTENGVQDVKYHTQIRWLSLCEVVKRFSVLLPHVVDFLKEQNALESFPQLTTEGWQNDLAFAVDVLSELNMLNLQLQGKGKFVFDMYNDVNSFTNGLQKRANDLQRMDFTLFPSLIERQEKITAEQCASYATIVAELHLDFQNRFADFRKINLVLSFMSSPFTINPNRFAEPLKSHVVLLQNDAEAIKLFAENNIQEFFHKLDDNKYSALKKWAMKAMVIFGSTYTCESTFSIMKLNKSKQRSQLSDDNLHHILKIQTTQVEIDFNELTTLKLEESNPSGFAKEFQR